MGPKVSWNPKRLILVISDVEWKYDTYDNRATALTRLQPRSPNGPLDLRDRRARLLGDLRGGRGRGSRLLWPAGDPGPPAPPRTAVRPQLPVRLSPADTR